ncbi:MAG: hypothetical protein K6G88_08825 [Lachnospiraceae bacterium]|nr:hypothetical protein [Lachnospiraceae bacterium]
MNYVSFSELLEKVLFYIDEDLLDVYGEEGIRNHLINYVHKVSPDKIKDVDGELSVSTELTSDEYVKKYLSKDDQCDYSAKDCADLTLRIYTVPPQEYMSIGSLEKRIREIFRKQRENIYIKRSKGKGNVVCVDRKNAEKIIMFPEVAELLKKQTEKAEGNHVFVLT